MMRRRLLVWGIVLALLCGVVVAQTLSVPLLPPVTPPAIVWNVVVYLGVGAVTWVFQDELSEAVEWLGSTVVDFVVDTYTGWTTSDVADSIVPFQPVTPASSPPTEAAALVTAGMLVACDLMAAGPGNSLSCSSGGAVSLTVATGANYQVHPMTPPTRIGSSSSYLEWQQPGWNVLPDEVYTSADGMGLNEIARVAVASNGGTGYIPYSLVYWDASPLDPSGQWVDDYYYEPSIQDLLLGAASVNTSLRKASAWIDDWDVGGLLRWPLANPDSTAYAPGNTSLDNAAWRATVPVGVQSPYYYTDATGIPLVAYVGTFDVYAIVPIYIGIDGTGPRGYGSSWITGFEVIRTRFDPDMATLAPVGVEGGTTYLRSLGGTWNGTMESLGYYFGISASWPFYDAPAAEWSSANWANVFWTDDYGMMTWYQSIIWAFVLPRLYGEDAVFPDLDVTVVQGGAATFPWNEAGALDYGTAVQQGTGETVSWIVNPVAAISAAFVPTVDLGARVDGYWTTLSTRFPFSLAGSLAVPMAVGVQAIPTPVLDMGRGLTIQARPDTINALTAVIRTAATVVVLVLGMVWVHRKAFPRTVI